MTVEIKVRVQWDSQFNGDPKEKLKAAIKNAYKRNDHWMSGYDTIVTESVEKDHPGEVGDPYVATLNTGKLAGWVTLSDVRSSVTQAVEEEFGQSIVGARVASQLPRARWRGACQ